MKRWSEFATEQPDMAEAGRALLYQFRVGLGYLATIRKDGGPRVHPVCPVIAHGGLYVFLGNHSPKVHDLLRDGRFALHAFPNPEVDDEFVVSGRARRMEDLAVRQGVYAAYIATGAFTSNDPLFGSCTSGLRINRIGLDTPGKEALGQASKGLGSVGESSGIRSRRVCRHPPVQPLPIREHQMLEQGEEHALVDQRVACHRIPLPRRSHRGMLPVF